MNSDRINNPLSSLLGPLQDNGGDMPTIMPLEGNPAIDGGTKDGFQLDEIEQTRPVLAVGAVMGGDGSDIGAYEVQCVSGPLPALAITLTGTGLTVSWPAPSFCFVLQQSHDLVNWVNSAFPVSLDNTSTQNQVTINPVPPGAIFFRLIHL
jgi:hypothetical protein